LNHGSAILKRSWSIGAGTLLLQDPQWAVKRSWEVPQDTINYFEAKSIQGDGLSLDDYAFLAGGFTEGQRVNTLLAHRYELARQIVPCLSLLQFYYQLSPSQKKSLLSPKGLQISHLKPKQWKCLINAIKERRKMNDPQTQLAGGSIGLTKGSGALSYTFSYVTTEGTIITDTIDLSNPYQFSKPTEIQ
jgi:hypothetical protein